MARKSRAVTQTTAEADAEMETETPPPRSAEGWPICPLCERPIPPAARSNLHHLTPKLKGGKRGPVVRLHVICHNEIHSALTEAELARAFHSVEALRAHPTIARFIAWIATKPPTFHSRSVGNHRRRNKRRRA